MLNLKNKCYWGICAAVIGAAANSFSAFSSGCTGTCGSCQLTCFPGIFAGGFILAGSFVKKIFRQRYDVKMKSHRIKTVIFFAAAIIITFGAVCFRKNNSNEREFLTFKVAHENKAVTVDIAQQGFLKYYLQPGVISVYCRGNITEPTGPLYAEFSGLDGFISQGSKKRVWKELQPEDKLQKRENGDIRINIEFSIPYNSTRQYYAGKGILEIFTAEKTVNRIVFNFINSKYPVHP